MLFRSCVATDVAARGIDLPTLSLVIHVELPRDAETLQHRSGRTGRAGKKGTAVLLVPYPRRRRVESMLRGAKIAFDWIDAPTPEAIRAQDQDRLLATLRDRAELDEQDWELGAQLLVEKSAKEIAAMLVRAHRAAMPAPEELIDRGAAPERREGPRPGFEDTVWFRMPIGRRHNADARWILPLICRRGHITRGDVGAIRINAGETLFEVPAEVAPRFITAVRRSFNEDSDEASLPIEQVEGGSPRQAARDNRKRLGTRDNASGRRDHGGPGGHSPRPFKGKPGGQRFQNKRAKGGHHG